MKIWYDATSGKHIRYGAALASHLRKLGHEVVFTTREHPDTIKLARLIGEAPTIVGKYAPESLSKRLEASLERMQMFVRMFKLHKPDVAVSSQSVEICRVAFGLGIPLIVTADTPHAENVNRLTIPLADFVVTSIANPSKVFLRYGAKRVTTFRGVDEVAWIQGFTPSKYNLKRPLIVVRQMETKAAYALHKTDPTEKIANELSALGNVVFLSRYDVDKVKRGPFDTASLVANADLVLSVGGTISREAALQGTPSVVLSDFGRIYVNEYLRRKGFPLFITTTSKAMLVARKHIGRRWDSKGKLEQLENPLETITKLIENRAI